MADKPWMMLTLSSGHKVKVDREDLDRLNRHTWRVTKGSTGRLRIVTSIRRGEKVRNLTLGAFLMKPPKGKQVYPRRFNEGLDYRKDNLIVCTLAERQRLLPKNRVKASSPFRGVSYSRTERKWRGGIQVKGRSINLGSFRTQEAAALAYNEAARKYFGERAYQNPVGRAKKKRQD